jgi:hypothetical protein
MDMYFRDALQAYADTPYNDLHGYLARRFHAWYAKFKPASSQVVSVGDAEWVMWCQLEVLTEKQHPLRNPGTV